ncbi:MAG: TetR family transcriptional regulator [Gammaproteobacteria bacterium]|jgi:AcrR family transcriptional regulator|nr:TetR family transcriptional regulator [Gammaproteobacteria bacterium]
MAPDTPSKRADPADPKPGRRTQAERTALSERRMLDAAVRLIAVQGVQKTTLRDIGEQAGYSRGLASYRYGSKSGLYRAVLRDVSQAWVSRLEAAVGERTGMGALAATLEAMGQFLGGSPEAIRAMYILWFEAVEPGSEVAPRVAEVQQIQRADVARRVREGIDAGEIRTDADPELVATEFAAVVFGGIFQWLINPRVDVPAVLRAYSARLVTDLERRS